jgi:glutamate/tyrosine decarboxylase-like PLP-dependent enzyme
VPSVGVALTRKQHVKKVEQHIDYLNSVDTTIMGSRNGQAPLFLWHALRKKGVDGIKAEVMGCLDNANYLRDSLRAADVTCALNDLSSTVVLERPGACCVHSLFALSLSLSLSTLSIVIIVVVVVVVVVVMCRLSRVMIKLFR